MANSPKSVSGKKVRLDYLVSKALNVTNAKAQAIIMAGSVYVSGKKETKPGQSFLKDAELTVKKSNDYVSRGALKLKRAYQDFKLDFKDKIICDVGASTGGFSDFSLQSGAKRVYAIDTGYGQIAEKIREDDRVILMEKTNIKNVDFLPEPIDCFVIDVSFISLKQVLPPILRIIKNAKQTSSLKPKTSLIALIKPQFEVGKSIADKSKGIIRDPDIQMQVVGEIGKFAEEIGLRVLGITESSITGAKGNKEFLIHLSLID